MRNRRSTMLTECPACYGEPLGPNVICQRCGGTGRVSYTILPSRGWRYSRRQAEVIAWLFMIGVIAVLVAAILLR